MTTSPTHRVTDRRRRIPRNRCDLVIFFLNPYAVPIGDVINQANRVAVIQAVLNTLGTASDAGKPHLHPSVGADARRKDIDILHYPKRFSMCALVRLPKTVAAGILIGVGKRYFIPHWQPV